MSKAEEGRAVPGGGEVTTEAAGGLMGCGSRTLAATRGWGTGEANSTSWKRGFHPTTSRQLGICLEAGGCWGQIMFKKDRSPWRDFEGEGSGSVKTGWGEAVSAQGAGLLELSCVSSKSIG